MLRREIALSPRTICATALLNVSARSARNRARTLAGGRCYSTGSTSDSGVAECLSARAARISGRGRRTAVAGGIVDASGRCARRCRRARSRVVASCRTMDLCPLRDFGRRTCNARPRRLVCGCASIRTQAHPDSPTVNSHQRVRVTHPERGVAWHCDLGSSPSLHRGLWTTRLPFRLPTQCQDERSN